MSAKTLQIQPGTLVHWPPHGRPLTVVRAVEGRAGDWYRFRNSDGHEWECSITGFALWQAKQ